MKTGKLLALGAGYVAGMIVALRFGKDGKNKSMDAIKQDIADIHKNLWTQAEAAIFSEENKQKVAEMRAQAEAEITEFKKDAQKKLRSLAKAGKEKRDEYKAELEALYARRAEILEELRKAALEAIDAGKETSDEAVEKLGKKVEKVSKELRKDLDDTYKTIKKKVSSAKKTAKKAVTKK